MAASTPFAADNVAGRTTVRNNMQRFIDTPTVLVVSERVDWRNDLAKHLEGETFDVVVDDCGDELLGMPELPGDLVVLDLGLRRRPAIDVCIDLRSRSQIPVLAVCGGSGDDLLLAVYEAGADVVVNASIGRSELLSRVRALVRHQRARPARESMSGPRPGSMTLLTDACAVVIGDTQVLLTQREFDALELLLRQPERVITRRELTAGWRTKHQDRALDFVIRRLRYKLEAVDDRLQIVVVRGVGFRLLTEDVVPI